MRVNKLGSILYTAKDLISLLPNSEIFFGKRDFFITNVSIDSRTIEQNGLFCALKGATHDGHAFIENAIKNGAICIFAEYIPQNVKDRVENGEVNVIIVPDTLRALTELAIFNRKRLKAKVIGVTGNIGKTTTKEFIANVLKHFFCVAFSPKTYNNHIGLPFTIANTPLNCEILVLEMGMNHLGEIEYLTNIAKPDISIITTIAPAHVENFNSIDDIVQAKAEIFKGMNPNAVAILNKENIYYDKLVNYANAEGIKNIFSIGTKNSHMFINKHYFTQMFSTKYEVCLNSKNGTEIIECETAGISYHNAFNTLFVFAIARLFSLDLKQVSQIVTTIPMLEGRGNIEKISTEGKSLTIINDAYNSSPEALKTAIKSLSALGSQYKNSRTVAVIGDMNELGDMANHYHQLILQDLIECKIQSVILVGPLMKLVYDGLPEEIDGRKIEKVHFTETRFLVKQIRKLIQNNDIILFKASRNMRFEVPIDKLYG